MVAVAVAVVAVVVVVLVVVVVVVAAETKAVVIFSGSSKTNGFYTFFSGFLKVLSCLERSGRLVASISCNVRQHQA